MAGIYKETETLTRLVEVQKKIRQGEVGFLEGNDDDPNEMLARLSKEGKIAFDWEIDADGSTLGYKLNHWLQNRVERLLIAMLVSDQKDVIRRILGWDTPAQTLGKILGNIIVFAVFAGFIWGVLALPDKYKLILLGVLALWILTKEVYKRTKWRN